jgi:hypothetical protein
LAKLNALSDIAAIELERSVYRITASYPHRRQNPCHSREPIH